MSHHRPRHVNARIQVANEIFEDSSPVGKEEKYFVDGCFDNILSFPVISAYERGNI